MDIIADLSVENGIDVVIIIRLLSYALIGVLI